MPIFIRLWANLGNIPRFSPPKILRASCQNCSWFTLVTPEFLFILCLSIAISTLKARIEKIFNIARIGLNINLQIKFLDELAQALTAPRSNFLRKVYFNTTYWNKYSILIDHHNRISSRAKIKYRILHFAQANLCAVIEWLYFLVKMIWIGNRCVYFAWN